jgi:hypothetical protein
LIKVGFVEASYSGQQDARREASKVNEDIFGESRPFLTISWTRYRGRRVALVRLYSLPEQHSSLTTQFIEARYLKYLLY